MGLLSPSLNYDPSVMEATVTNVDPIRFTCSVRTVRGQYFNEVPWLLSYGGSGKNGLHVAPSIGDQAVVWTALSYPVIVGFLPRLGTPSTVLTNVSGQELGLDVGNNSNMKNGFVTNPDKPSDFTPGDIVMTSEGGGILGLLANGSAIIKGSALAQIFVTKFDDLVRVVARNWERFSDVGQQTAANVQGRLYEFLGWDRKLSRSKNGLYELQEVTGDVAAGEVLLGEPNASTALPVADTRVRKFWLQDANGVSRMIELLYEDGKVDLLIQDALTTTNTRETQITNKYEVTSTAPASFSKVTITPTDITLDFNNGAAKARLDDTTITLDYHNGTSKTVMNQTGITSTHGSGTHIMDDNRVHAQFGAHFATVDSSGVHLG